MSAPTDSPARAEAALVRLAVAVCRLAAAAPVPSSSRPPTGLSQPAEKETETAGDERKRLHEEAQLLYEAVVAREAVSAALAALPAEGGLSPTLRSQLHWEDQHLRRTGAESAERLDVFFPTLMARWRDERWRERRQGDGGSRLDASPPRVWGEVPRGWWWHLDEVAQLEAQHREKRARRQAGTHRTVGLLNTLTAFVLLAAAVALAADVVRRFLTGGPDLTGILGTVFQGALALFAGGTLTRAGQQWLERAFVEEAPAASPDAGSTQSAKPPSYPVGRPLPALLLCLPALLAWLLLPAVARRYNERGNVRREEGRWAEAAADYQRAVSLDPVSPQARYNLAFTHEQALQYDSAIAEYTSAVQAGSRRFDGADFYFAQNNLARLYIAHKKEYAKALILLARAEAAVEAEAAVKAEKGLTPQKKAELLYRIWKNRGWALLELKQPRLAGEYLETALSYNTAGAAALYLKALALEARYSAGEAVLKEETLAAWTAAVSADPALSLLSGRSTAVQTGGVDDVEPAWRTLAQERVSPGGTLPPVKKKEAEE